MVEVGIVLIKGTTPMVGGSTLMGVGTSMVVIDNRGPMGMGTKSHLVKLLRLLLRVRTRALRVMGEGRIRDLPCQERLLPSEVDGKERGSRATALRTVMRWSLSLRLKVGRPLRPLPRERLRLSCFPTSDQAVRCKLRLEPIGHLPHRIVENR